MQRILVERRLRQVHARLVRARQELAVLEEQLAAASEAADDARIRSLVSETPLAAHEYGEVQRQVDAMSRARDAMVADVNDLERHQDALIADVGGAKR